MADRNFQKKKRNDVRRKRRPVLIFTGEGKNNTEKQYFLSFQEQHGKYSIQFVNTGFDAKRAYLHKRLKFFFIASFVRSLITSPPMISPATEGTNATEPGVERRLAKLPVLD